LNKNWWLSQPACVQEADKYGPYVFWRVLPPGRQNLSRWEGRDVILNTSRRVDTTTATRHHAWVHGKGCAPLRGVIHAFSGRTEGNRWIWAWWFGRKGLREEEGGRAARSLFTEVNGASTTESTAGAVLGHTLCACMFQSCPYIAGFSPGTGWQ